MQFLENDNLDRNLAISLMSLAYTCQSKYPHRWKDSGNRDQQFMSKFYYTVSAFISSNKQQ